MKILVIPDVHGRKFWKKPCENIEEYDHIVFLGDYLDPYDFEHISVEDAMINFEDIIDFAKANSDKVTLLLGNHDMPYFSKTYKRFSMWHCRHAYDFCNDIAHMFDEIRDRFKIATVIDDILFTHAGCTSGWLEHTFTEDFKITSIEDLAFSLNNLLNTEKGLSYLYRVSADRGGRDGYGSCIWADKEETYWDMQNALRPDVPVSDIQHVKQVYGHSLQLYYDRDYNLVEGDPIEFENHKMLDNRNAYVLDTETFEITKIEKETQD